MHNRVAVSSRPAAKLAEIPLPPARAVEHADGRCHRGQLVGEPARQPATELAFAEAIQAVPLPARGPPDAALSPVHRAARVALPRIITGAKRIVPPGFSAYADMGR
jgi:hypothetical protein